MYRFITLSLFFAALALQGGNLLKSNDIAKPGWRLWITPELTMDNRFEAGKCLLQFPPQPAGKPGTVQLYRIIPLEAGRDYRFSFRLKADRGGSLVFAYGYRVKPYGELSREELRVLPGEHLYHISFRFKDNPEYPADASKALKLHLGGLAGNEATVSEAALEEVTSLEAPKTWKLFLRPAYPAKAEGLPDTLPAKDGTPVRPTAVTLEQGKLDFAPLSPKWEFKDCAMLYAEVEAAEAGVRRLGFAADWRFEFYVNGEKVYSTVHRGGNGSSRLSPDNHPVDFMLNKGKNVLAAAVFPGSNGWSFYCGPTAKLPRPGFEGIAPEQLPSVILEPGADWKVIDTNDLAVKTGTAIDLSSLVDAPAGLHGRAVINPEGKLAFANNPNQSVRLRGFNAPFEQNYPFTWDRKGLRQSKMSDEGFRSWAREYAVVLRRQGYNLIRWHLEHSAWHGTPEEQDRHDYFLAEIKKQGCYIMLCVLDHRGSYHENSLNLRLSLYLGDEETRSFFRRNAEHLLNKVNPYTGLTRKDDPSLICVEACNEQEGSLLWPTLRGHRVRPETVALLDRRFAGWLRQKYGSLEALKTAWKTPDIPSFEAVKAPAGRLAGNSTSPNFRDFTLFTNDLAVECARFCEEAIRATGYPGLTAQYDVPVWFGDLAARYSNSPVALAHTYWAHPIAIDFRSQIDDKRGFRLNTDDSSLTDGASYWRSTAAARFAGRPFMVTEYNHCWPNAYQYECGLLWGAYSSLQDFSALLIHAYAVNLTGARLAAHTASSPVQRAGEFLAAMLFQRGDAQSARSRVELEIPNDLLAYKQPVSPEQSKLSLLTGFTITFPGLVPAAGTVKPAPATLRLPATLADGKFQSQDDFINVAGGSDKGFSINSFLRTAKVLPAGNRTDPEKGVYHSDTGEIEMRTREKLLKVTTPRTEAVALPARQREKLDSLEVLGSNVNALIGITSVDGEPLPKSRRLVLVYATDNMNSGMRVSYDRTFYHGWTQGELPILLKTGVLELTFTTSERLNLYALSLNGLRKEQLPAEFRDGKLHLKIDTAQLKDGPTPFFELSEK